MTAAIPHTDDLFAPSGHIGASIRGWWAGIVARCRAGLAAALPVERVPSRTVRADLPAGASNIRLADRPMDDTEQWRRTVRSLEAATASARSMRELHTAASRQLDSVDYALDQLFDDLSAIMTVPRAPRASLHELRPLGPVAFSAAPQLHALAA